MIHDLRKEKLLLIEPSIFESKCKALDDFNLNEFLAARPKLAEVAASAEKASWDTDIYGDEIPKMEIIGNVAIVPICGVLLTGCPSVYKLFGFIDCFEIRAWLQSAIANPEIEKIILDVNCPGGTVTGVRELAELIQNSPKRIGVFCDAGQDASACYWITAGAYAVCGTPSSIWGSIGVYSVWTESKGAYEQAGLLARVFRSGKMKGIGEDGTELTPEQAEFLQSRVVELGAEFRTYVKKFRPIKDEDMEGQWYDAAQAAQRGFIDQVVTGINEVITLLG